MEALCQVGNKSALKPPNPYQGLHLFYILMVGQACTLAITAFGTIRVLPDQITPKILWQYLGLEFISCGSIVYPLPRRCSNKACKASCSRGKSCILALHYQCNGFILPMWTSTQRGPQLPSDDILWVCGGSFR